MGAMISLRGEFAGEQVEIELQADAGSQGPVFKHDARVGTRTSSDAGIVLENRTLGPSVGLQLNFNLFTGEFPSQTYHRAHIALTSAELRKRQALLQAQTEVLQDHAAFLAADSALSLEREA